MEQMIVDGLLRAFGLVVLERREDGAFVAVSAVPEWFPAVSRDGTFPFLGGFLDEAASFWAAAGAGDDRTGSGLCAATDEAGREFHFEAWAVRAGERRLLVFERSEAAVQLQDTLQRAREEKLAKAASDKAARDALQVLHALTREVRQAVEAIRNLVSASDELPGEAGQREIIEAVRVAVASLGARVDTLIGR
jgi:hypothetical protein